MYKQSFRSALPFSTFFSMVESYFYVHRYMKSFQWSKYLIFVNKFHFYLYTKLFDKANVCFECVCIHFGWAFMYTIRLLFTWKVWHIFIRYALLLVCVSFIIEMEIYWNVWANSKTSMIDFVGFFVCQYKYELLHSIWIVLWAGKTVMPVLIPYKRHLKKPDLFKDTLTHKSSEIWHSSSSSSQHILFTI